MNKRLKSKAKAAGFPESVIDEMERIDKIEGLQNQFMDQQADVIVGILTEPGVVTLEKMRRDVRAIIKLCVARSMVDTLEIERGRGIPTSGAE